MSEARATVGRMTTPIGILGVPSSAAAHAPGLELGPAALRAAGLIDALRGAGHRVDDHGDTPVARWRHDPPVRTAPHDVERVTAGLQVTRAAVREVLDAGHVPLVLGGECTVTLAVVAALADAGRDVGLLYVDGGQDLQIPADHPDEPIADSTGVAHLLDLPGTHEALAGLGPRRPLLARRAAGVRRFRGRRRGRPRAGPRAAPPGTRRHRRPRCGRAARRRRRRRARRVPGAPRRRRPRLPHAAARRHPDVRTRTHPGRPPNPAAPPGPRGRVPWARRRRGQPRPRRRGPDPHDQARRPARRGVHRRPVTSHVVTAP